MRGWSIKIGFQRRESLPSALADRRPMRLGVEHFCHDFFFFFFLPVVPSRLYVRQQNPCDSDGAIILVLYTSSF